MGQPIRKQNSNIDISKYCINQSENKSVSIYLAKQ